MSDAPLIGIVCQKPANEHGHVDELSPIAWATAALLSSMDQTVCTFIIIKSAKPSEMLVHLALYGWEVVDLTFLFWLSCADLALSPGQGPT